MQTTCQCRAEPVSTRVWEESTLCDPDRFIETVNFQTLNPNDPTGRDGYRLMRHFPIQTQREIIGHLPTSGYGGQVRRFATAVTQVAGELITRYSTRPCNTDDFSAAPAPITEKPLRGAKWTLRVFVRRFLRRKAPDLAKLPIQYTSQHPTTRAAYSPSKDTIFVGNTIIREIRSKQNISVLSTLYHEKTHRDTEVKHRTFTEPLVNEAIALAADYIHNPGCTTEVFKRVANHQFWWEKDSDGANEFVDHEDELYARITQLAFRSAHRREQTRTTDGDMETYEAFLHSHIAGIANRFSPIVAGVILDYVAETVKADIPKGYSFLTSNMYSDAHYIQIRTAMESYRNTHQVCQSGQQPICNVPSDTDARMMAEPNY